jgi:hypothetical protein
LIVGQGDVPTTVDIFLALLTHESIKLVFYRFGVGPDQMASALASVRQFLDANAEAEYVARLPFVALLESLKLRNRSVDPLMLLCGLATLLPDEHPIQKLFFNLDLSYDKLEVIAAWVFNIDLLIEEDKVFRKLAQHHRGPDSGLTKND